MPKYENAIVYKLCCDDPEITDIFVGSTCNFKVRKWQHKTSCNNENSKEYNRYVYQYIRENGGWDAWSMILIKKYPDVVDNQELLMKERKWITKLNATLNKRVPCALLELGKTEYDKQHYEKNKTKLLEYGKQHYEKNKTKLLEYGKQYSKHYREQNSIKILEKANEKIECECGCMIGRSHIARHIKTKKHIELLN
jgi:hypothetical protein